MPWKVLADAVMVLHLLIMGFFGVSAVLLALGIFQGHRNWQLFYGGVIVLAVGIRVTDWLGILKSCSVTDLEYMVRRLYDPSESWLRTRSLLGTLILNATGIQVPESAFTIMWVIVIVVMIASLVIRRA